MPDRSCRKSRQFFSLSREITVYRDTSLVIFVGGSNDFESFLVQHGQFLKQSNHSQKRWNSLSSEDKSHFNYHRNRLLHKRSERHLKWKLRVYVGQLGLLFKQSSATVVYHVSVLERMLNWEPLLPMYFAMLNSLLFTALKAASITNRYGQPIRFQFINVSSCFFMAKNPKSLFKNSEIAKGVMTHRTTEAYKEVYTTIYNHVKSDLPQCIDHVSWLGLLKRCRTIVIASTEI